MCKVCSASVSFVELLMIMQITCIIDKNVIRKSVSQDILDKVRFKCGCSIQLHIEKLAKCLKLVL